VDQLKKCVMCGQEACERARVSRERTVGGVAFSMELEGDRCANCGETYYDLQAMGQFEQAVAYKLAELGIAAGDSFKILRRRLELRAADVAEMLDVTPETISRWERGAVPVDKAAFLVLAAIYLEKHEGEHRMIDRLRAARPHHVRLSA
jgi:putative zinc finger/helix-turn-helix YgiT family protein